MLILRKYCRYLSLVALLLWTHTVVAAQEQLHDHVAEDCVICKIVEMADDKIDVTQSCYQPCFTSDFVLINVAQTDAKVEFWQIPLMRAPPVIL